MYFSLLVYPPASQINKVKPSQRHGLIIDKGVLEYMLASLHELPLFSFLSHDHSSYTPQRSGISLSSFLSRWLLPPCLTLIHYLCMCIQPSNLMFQFIHGNFLDILPYDSFRDFPDLNQVIFCGTADHPWFILIPAKVCKMICVTSMHK